MATEAFVGTTTIESRGDADWLKVHLTAGQIYGYSISVPSGYYFQAQLYNADSTPLAMARPYTNAGYFTVPVTGDYFFSIGAEGNGAIALSVSIISVVDALPGATFTTASIAVGQTLSIANQTNIGFNQDWFGVDLVAGQTYVLTSGDPNTGGGSGGTTFFVDPTGQMISSGRHFTAPTSGRYFAAIEPSSNVLNYNLTLGTVADDRPDLITSAGALTVGSASNGLFEAPGDLDWYAVTLDANTSYRLNLASAQETGNLIRVSDATGKVVYDTVNSGAPSSFAIFTATNAGTYYVGAYFGGFGGTTSSTYTLTATTLSGDLPDNVATTARVTVGAPATSGSWEAPGDTDWLKIDLVQGQSYDIILNSATNAFNSNMSFGLYDPAGRLITTVGGASFGSNLAHTAEISGTYYIGARTGVAQGYSISATTYSDDYADNTLTTGVLTVNGSASGRSETVSDVDWFAVNLLANRTYVVGGAGGGVLDSAGNLLNPGGTGDLTVTPITSGIYYVAASGAGSDYTVSITQISDDNVDNASTTGVLYQQFNGTAGADTINGTAYPSQLNGLGGDDILIGGASKDQLSGGDGNDLLFGGAGGDLLNGGNGDDLLYGEADNDTLSGGAGNDRLDGGAGADLMSGGTGDDLYIVDNVGDGVGENGNSGNDTVEASITYSIAARANVENITLTGADNLDATGNAANNMLIGNSGANRLDGGTGTDRLYGGLGDDTYVVDQQGDLVFENGNEGTDTVISTSNFYLYANIENLALAAGAGTIFGVGNDLDNTITGNEAANTLLGGAGADTIRAGAGVDIVYGETGNDQLFGDADNDFLAGGIGDDTLDGGTGGDSLYGEDGNDTLIGGSDFVFDQLVGGNGDDILRGDSGLGDYDYLYGNAGNDSFYVDTPADLVFEQAGEGTDTVYANINGGGYYLYANIEDLVLLGNTPFGVGNDLANRLTGNATGNWLLGGAGNDVLNGKGGNDVLFGEGGADTFVFERGTGGDVIGDFVAGTDKIDLSAFGFASFAAVQAATGQNGSDSFITLGNGDLIVLNGVASASLQAGDFILTPGQTTGGELDLGYGGDHAAIALPHSEQHDWLESGFARYTPDFNPTLSHGGPLTVQLDFASFALS